MSVRPLDRLTVHGVIPFNILVEIVDEGRWTPIAASGDPGWLYDVAEQEAAVHTGVARFTWMGEVLDTVRVARG